jgi:preprotein translocase subunit Sec61beta
MADTGISVPGGFGGLVRYSEEYTSKILLKPIHVIAIIILVLAARIIVPYIF